MKFDDLLDKDLAREELRTTILKNNYGYGSTGMRCEQLQKKIVKMFLKMLLDDIMNHKVFYFPKKILTLQIGVVNRPKTYKFDYMTGNTLAVCFLRTSVRFFKKMRKVKPFVRIKDTYYRKIQNIHRTQSQYYNK